MRFISALLLSLMMLTACTQKEAKFPWDNGKLQVDETGCFLQHENGEPFFWLGETGWLLPERLNREDAEFYLEACRQAGNMHPLRRIRQHLCMRTLATVLSVSIWQR